MSMPSKLTAKQRSVHLRTAGEAVVVVNNVVGPLNGLTARQPAVFRVQRYPLSDTPFGTRKTT
ncbi:hypothetical protein [Paraburkholderia youngii]|uniref:hypothetical protein n=1 Tax=Paraburkholderia youngii TaxID=2782701 RepID=UPI003D1EB494